MAPVQMLRAILHALASPNSLDGEKGNFMQSPGASEPVPPATRAAFRGRFAALLVEHSGQLNLAASLTAAELQQVGRAHSSREHAAN